MKRARLRRQSSKTARLERSCREMRKKLVESIWLCECCLKRESQCCHEIANGPMRQQALDKRYLLLAACVRCNGEELTDKGKWPVAWQLGMLRESRPHDFDLARANEVLMRRVAMEDVTTLPPDWWRRVT